MNKVYLIPQNEAEYQAYIGPDTPTADAVCLTQEGSYPVDIYSWRYDINMNRVYEIERCDTRQQLLEHLNWCGHAHNGIRKLWEFDSQSNLTQSVYDLFQAGYDYIASIPDGEWWKEDTE